MLNTLAAIRPQLGRDEYLGVGAMDVCHYMSLPCGYRLSHGFSMMWDGMPRGSKKRIPLRSTWDGDILQEAGERQLNQEESRKISKPGAEGGINPPALLPAAALPSRSLSVCPPGADNCQQRLPETVKPCTHKRRVTTVEGYEQCRACGKVIKQA